MENKIYKNLRKKSGKKEALAMKKNSRKEN